MTAGIAWHRHRGHSMLPQGADGDPGLGHGWGDYDFHRAIWLPVPPEPVTVTTASGESLPGRVLHRRASSLTIAIVVPWAALGTDELEGLIVEYTNPCGSVRFTGKVTASQRQDCVRIKVRSPELVSVVQQRAYVRAEVERPVEVETPDGSLHTRTVDLSGGGMRLAERGALVCGETVGFAVDVSPGARPIVGTARTVRFDAEARPALEFVSISVADRWRLVRFILELQRDGLAPTVSAEPAMGAALGEDADSDA